MCLTTLLSQAQAEVVGHWGVGVGRDGVVALLLGPLDQSLGA